MGEVKGTQHSNSELLHRKPWSPLSPLSPQNRQPIGHWSQLDLLDFLSLCSEIVWYEQKRTTTLHLSKNTDNFLFQTMLSNFQRTLGQDCHVYSRQPCGGRGHYSCRTRGNKDRVGQWLTLGGEFANDGTGAFSQPSDLPQRPSDFWADLRVEKDSADYIEQIMCWRSWLETQIRTLNHLVLISLERKEGVMCG